jgi:hypothetical protein
MTTKAAEALYQAQHNYAMEGKKYAIYNPHNKPIEKLPFIYGFNNGGSPGWYSAVLLAEDGTGLGGHLCSHECYMEHDLGILEGTRSDRHEEFKKHYPDGYRMTFIPFAEVRDHQGLKIACDLNEKKYEEEQQAEKKTEKK